MVIKKYINIIFFSIATIIIFNSLLIFVALIDMVRTGFNYWFEIVTAIPWLDWIIDTICYLAKMRADWEVVVILIAYFSIVISIGLFFWIRRPNVPSAFLLAISGTFAGPPVTLFFFDGELWIKAIKLMSISYAGIFVMAILFKCWRELITD